jgi:DeoR family transcriptional regulator of aga operon
VSADELPQPAPLRRQRIAAELESRGFVRNRALAALLRVSMVTVRTDLHDMEADGLLSRVHGGAVALGAPERPFEQTATENAAAKRAIAARVVDLLAPGMTVALDVGTTTDAVARAIAESPRLDGLLVVTNGLTIARSLEAVEHVEVVVTGGTLRPLQHSLVNPFATAVLASLDADVAILGCNGVAVSGGVTNANAPEAEVKRAMMRSARQVVVAADGSKIGRTALARFADLTDLHRLVTDATGEGPELADIRSAGVTVDVVGS